MKPIDINLTGLDRGDAGLNIIGLRLVKGSSRPDYFYYILFVNADEYSLLRDNRVLLFRSVRQAKTVLATAPAAFQYLGPHPARADLVVDIPKAVELAENDTYDPSAYLLNLLNRFFDVIECLGISLGEYQTSLWAFADHLTTDKDFGLFFQNSGFTREEICKGLYWLVGAVMSHTVIFQGS